MRASSSAHLPNLLNAAPPLPVASSPMSSSVGDLGGLEALVQAATEERRRLSGDMPTPTELRASLSPRASRSPVVERMSVPTPVHASSYVAPPTLKISPIIPRLPTPPSASVKHSNNNSNYNIRPVQPQFQSHLQSQMHMEALPTVVADKDGEPPPKKRRRSSGSGPGNFDVAGAHIPPSFAKIVSADPPAPAPVPAVALESAPPAVVAACLASPPRSPPITAPVSRDERSPKRGGDTRPPVHIADLVSKEEVRPLDIVPTAPAPVTMAKMEEDVKEDRMDVKVEEPAVIAAATSPTRSPTTAMAVEVPVPQPRPETGVETGAGNGDEELKKAVDAIEHDVVMGSARAEVKDAGQIEKKGAKRRESGSKKERERERDKEKEKGQSGKHEQVHAHAHTHTHTHHAPSTASPSSGSSNKKHSQKKEPREEDAHEWLLEHYSTVSPPSTATRLPDVDVANERGSTRLSLPPPATTAGKNGTRPESTRRSEDIASTSTSSKKKRKRSRSRTRSPSPLAMLEKELDEARVPSPPPPVPAPPPLRPLVVHARAHRSPSPTSALERELDAEVEGEAATETKMETSPDPGPGSNTDADVDVDVDVDVDELVSQAGGVEPTHAATNADTNAADIDVEMDADVHIDVDRMDLDVEDELLSLLDDKPARPSASSKPSVPAPAPTSSSAHTAPSSASNLHPHWKHGQTAGQSQGSKSHAQGAVATAAARKEEDRESMPPPSSTTSVGHSKDTQTRPATGGTTSNGVNGSGSKKKDAAAHKVRLK